jgi:amidohydrolase
MKRILLLQSLLITTIAFSQTQPKNYNTLVEQELKKVIDWRRDIHQNPELSNREFKTQEKVFTHLQSLGLEVRKLAKTGVVGILRTNKPGPTIALRADMDALPVKERNNLLFKSTVKTVYNNDTVGVMHACGHDAHTAMLMGTAEVLSKLKNELTGIIVFLFQPAEEGAPTGEEGGAKLMIKEGCLENPKPDAVFGIHIESFGDNGKIYYKTGAFMASADLFTIKVKGKQSHGAYPWNGVDPIVTSAQIIEALQTIVSRQTNIAKAPVVITVGKINSGVRFNIIPEEALMEGTIRTLDSKMRLEVFEKIRNTVNHIAAANGATAEVNFENKTLVTYNNPKLVEQSLPSLQIATGGKDNVIPWTWEMGAEDFSFYGENIPAFFFYLGVRDPKIKMEAAPSHHTPDFYIDDSRLDVGIKAFCQLIFDYGKSR